MTIDRDTARLERLLRTQHPCVHIVTPDEQDALDVVRGAAFALDIPVTMWSAVAGLRDEPFGRAREIPDTENPAAAMYEAARRRERLLLLLLDVGPHLADPIALRALREAVEAVARRGGHTVLIECDGHLPPVVLSCSTPLGLSLPQEAELEDLVRRLARRTRERGGLQVELTRGQLNAMVQNLRGLRRRQAERVLNEVLLDDRRLDASDVAGVLGAKRRLLHADGLLEFVEAPASLDEIGGLGILKRWLGQRRRSHGPKAESFGLQPPRGVLMLGVQGAGKSLCAKAIAAAWERPLLRLDPGVLYDRYVGQSERRLRDALAQAEAMAPIVLWIDEIEKAFASAASQSSDGGLSQRMFGSLLTWMQEHEAPVFLVATANDIGALPPELLRKGRFDEIFFVDLPGEAARREIFEIHLRRRKREPEKFDLDALVEASEGYSGAEIEQGIVSALHEAFSEGADLDTGRVRAALAASPPLSVTMRERIASLRAWAGGACRRGDYAPSSAFKNSSRETPACVQMVRSVEPLIVEWLGIVRGVFEPRDSDAPSRCACAPAPQQIRLPATPAIPSASVRRPGTSPLRDLGFAQKDLDVLLVGLDRIVPERIDMKADRRLHIRKGVFI